MYSNRSIVTGSDSQSIKRMYPKLSGKTFRLIDWNSSVVIITSLFHPYYGGAERQLERLAERLALRGVKCYVLTRRLDCLKSFECLHNVPIYRVFATDISSGLLSALTFIISSCSFL